jgi:hypothetical protein
MVSLVRIRVNREREGMCLQERVGSVSFFKTTPQFLRTSSKLIMGEPPEIERSYNLYPQLYVCAKRGLYLALLLLAFFHYSRSMHLN